MRLRTDSLLTLLLLSAPAALLRAQEEAAAAAKPADAPWDVTAQHGPAQSVELDVDEGTWIQIDVSPDGATLVFDLLGDLWSVPIGGGEATLLLGGGAWEWQPRFSPDGTRIAFVSDRGGGDNVWVCDRDGGNLRAVTREEFRLVHAPEWTPDGEWIAVRKHFTHTRSLGAGEIWLYHESGEGAGVSLTDKSSNTADVNEPAFSRDGRWLYHSQAGDFDYNKNVHQGIYAVRRIDRTTGKSEPVSDGAGGACRPRPSPDGRSLAMIRRVGLKTALVVRDLESGRERVLFDGLDHDTMETWSIHGTFPGYAWLPDSSAIVIWAGGRLTRVEARGADGKPAAPGAASVIPFRARSTHRLHEALRFPRRVDEGPFGARLVRWPRLSPDGRTAWFQALGRIWRQELAGGPATALETSGCGGGFAQAPALSPDGTWLVFVTFENGVGGHLWRVPSGGGACTRLTSSPGSYANPAISPDGRRVAFLAGTGGSMRGRPLSAEPSFEIRWLFADGGGAGGLATTTANRGAARRMTRLHFSAGGEDLLYFESAEEKTAFVRVTLDGREKRTLFTSEDAEEIAPSPDGRWIAFKEQHQIWVAPLPDAIGRPLVIARSGAPVPVRKLTETGGSWPFWSADGRTVGWVLGPDLVLQEVAPLFEPKPAAAAPQEGAAKPGAAEREFTDAGVRPGARVVALAAEARPDPPRAPLALVGARLVTMRGDEVIEDGTLLLDGARIRAIGPRADVAVPAGAKVIDVAGRTILPGLIDVHSHMHYNALDVLPAQPWEYLANLAYGVTTAHDPSASTELVFAQSELVRAGAMLGPRIFSTGYILYGAKNPNKAEIESLDDARHHLRRLKALGAFSVKSYNQPRRNQRQWVIEAAREERMLVMPEGGSLLAANLTMCLDGHTGIEHNLPVAPLYDDVIGLFARSGTGITPTLVVSYGGLNGEHWWYQHERVFEKEPLRSLTPPGYLDALARRRDVFAFDDDFRHFQMAQACRDLVRAGGHVQLGAHGQLQGLAAHWELWMFGQGGMTPLEAIRCGTYYGAWYLGLDQDLGSLEPGKLADFAVLARNPLERLEHSDSVELVCAGGRLLDARTLAQLHPEAKPRPRLQWE